MARTKSSSKSANKSNPTAPYSSINDSAEKATEFKDHMAKMQKQPQAKSTTKAYESTQEETKAHYNDNGHSSGLRLKQVVPDIALALDDLNEKLDRIESRLNNREKCYCNSPQFQTNMNYLIATITEVSEGMKAFQAFGNMFAPSSTNAPATIASTISAPNIASTALHMPAPHPAQPSPISTYSVPQYEIQAKSVDVLWVEFTEGLSNHDSVDFLEKTHGTRWRRLDSNSKAYNRRKHIVDYIKKRISDEKLTSNEEIKAVVDEVEQFRRGKKWALHKLDAHYLKLSQQN